jgi:broad specificity phosphatase PhoE
MYNLLRRSVRPPIPAGETERDIELTREGLALAHELGVLVGNRLVSCSTSPAKRRVQTAEAMVAGAGANSRTSS